MQSLHGPPVEARGGGNARLTRRRRALLGQDSEGGCVCVVVVGKGGWGEGCLMTSLAVTLHSDTQGGTNIQRT